MILEKIILGILENNLIRNGSGRFGQISKG